MLLIDNLLTSSLLLVNRKKKKKGLGFSLHFESCVRSFVCYFS